MFQFSSDLVKPKITISLWIKWKRRLTTACMTSSRSDWACLQLFFLRGSSPQNPMSKNYHFLFIRIGVSSKRSLTTACMTSSRGVWACHHLFSNKGTIQWVPRKGIRTLSWCAQFSLVILLRSLTRHILDRFLIDVYIIFAYNEHRWLIYFILE